MKHFLTLIASASVLVSCQAPPPAACSATCCQSTQVAFEAIDPEAMEPMEIMQAMMEMGAPGEEHAELMTQAGLWETRIRMRMAPDAPWEEYSGSSKIQKALGGRYLIEKFEAEMGMMGTMSGLLILGYSNLTEEYQSLWFDSSSTYPSIAKGKVREDGRTELHGMMKDLITPQGRPYRIVITPKSNDHYLMEMYDTIPPAGEVMVMTIDYHRKG